MHDRADTFHQPQPGRFSQPGYSSTGLSELERRMEAIQKQTNNETQNQSSTSSYRTGLDEIGHVDSATSYRHDSLHDIAGARTPLPAGSVSSPRYPYRPSTSHDIRPVRDETVQSELLARRAAYPPTPLPDRTSLYRPPLAEAQHDTYSPSTSRQQGMQRSISHSYNDQFYSNNPHAASFTPTPDRSTIGSPISQTSPDSLRRELEATKEYSERMLTKLMETEQLLADRSQMLAAALDDLKRAQRQSEIYSQECLRLRDNQNPTRQPAQPAVASGQLEEAQKVTDFYRQKAEQLSKQNMNISRQNRKLTEDLAIIQRKFT